MDDRPIKAHRSLAQGPRASRPMGRTQNASDRSSLATDRSNIHLRLNTKQPVLDYEGRPLLTNKTNPDGSPVLGENHRPVQVPETVRSYLVLALNNKSKTETEPIGAEEAAKRYQLSTKLYAKNDVDLTHTECAFLLERIVAIHGDSPLIVGRISDILEDRDPVLPDTDDQAEGNPSERRTTPAKKS
jgi:hypothetical protein